MARSKFAIAFTLAGTVLSSAAQALGLGAIEAKTALNQPLDARIPLISAHSGELDSLSVSLASSSAFERAGVARPFHLSQLKFEVVRGDRPYIKVTTRNPVKEPFLDFLVEANWPRGRLVREFTLLLDPPVYAAKGQAPSLSAPAPAASAAAAPASPASSGGATAVAAPRARGAVALADSAGAPAQYAVRSSDTLWQVAQSLRPDRSISVNQMMVALLQANPDAFIDGDMNRLKRGAVLRVPDAATVGRIDAAAANAQVRQQLARWRQDQDVAAPAAESTGTASRLQVVAPTNSGGEQAASSLVNRDLEATPQAVAELKRELTLSEEAAASLRAENEELKAQVEALKQQLSSVERLVEVKTEQPVPGAAAAPAAGQPAAESAPAEQAAAPVAAEAPTPVVEEQAKVEPKPAAPAKPKPAPEPIAAPGFFDDPMNLGMAGGVGVAVLALAYLLVRRRRKGDSEELPAVAVPELVDEPAEPEVVVAAAADEAEVEPAAQGQDMPPESDPLSEAEVYLAYGRYDQAQDVIAKALAQAPERSDLRLKLMEVLALTQDTAGFEAQAQALRERVDAADPAWQRALEMGREFLPESPLFAGGDDLAEPVAETAPAAEMDFGDFAFDEAPAEAEDAAVAEVEPVEAPAGADLGLEFDLDLGGEQPEEATVAETADTGLDFALDEPEQAEPAALEFEEAAEAADLDFQLDEPAQGGDDAGLDFQLDEPVQEQADDNVVEFSLPEDEATEAAGLDDALDEVGTKLDLARAYLDMGDADGARSLLDEVLEEGSAVQKREAEGLLRQIA